jgi:hypothetical protein
MFAATWLIALTIWRLGRIEERWSADLVDSGSLEGADGDG